MFKGLGQNIVALNKEEISKIHNERKEKIIKLGLKQLSDVSEAVSDEIEENKTPGLLKKIEPGVEVDDILDDITTSDDESENE
jgi:hypothetical protein